MLLQVQSRSFQRLLLLGLALLLGSLSPLTARAQELSALSDAYAEPGSELTIYVVTMGPGSLVYERFGHNALWVQDALRGTDQLYNYGLFDFQQENFILRFVQGRMHYWMQGDDAMRSIDPYIWDDRSVWIQELNLTPRQRVQLRDFLLWNERPENRFYWYDYYRDNCSTRVRDAIDHMLGGQIRAQTETIPSGTTYRSHTRRLTTSDVPIYTGLNLALGQGVDREISAWEEMFIPMRMQEHLRTLAIRDEAGREVPLVRSEQTLYLSTRGPERQAPPVWLPSYLAVGVFLAGLLTLLARLSLRSRAARFGFAGLSGLWLLLAGTAGVIIAGLWAFTDHAAAYRNENLLQMSPLALPLVVLVPALAYGARWAARPALWLSLAVAALSVLGLLLKVLPGFVQVNGEIIALALPVNLGMAVTAYYLSSVLRDSARTPTASTSPPPPSRRRAAPAR